VFGEVPLVHNTQVVSEKGEPLAWMKDYDYPIQKNPDKDHYGLCRCGQSKNMPLCDRTHRQVGFDGRETADPRPTAARAVAYSNGTRIIVKKDSHLCMLSCFCGFSDARMYQLVGRTADTKMRALVMAIVERCPSGALTYRIESDGPDIEADLPVQIAVTTEITSGGLIPGPLWVSGNIPVECSEGQPCETRNRVTLCNCGRSCTKPLCDGTHRSAEEQALRQKRVGEEKGVPLIRRLFPD
jgi:CDGSH-type Zn-finger protein